MFRKYFISTLALMPLFIVFTGATCTPGQTAEPVYEFVGISDQGLLLGTVGALQMTITCQAEFGVGARLCTSEEILNSTDIPLTIQGSAWVRPTFVLVEDGLVVDISGVARSVAGAFTCTGWGVPFTGNNHLTVTRSGNFDTELCSVGRNVACCEPT